MFLTNIFLLSRDIFYKYSHEILANDRLYMFKILDENKCINCSDLENMHMIYLSLSKTSKRMV